MESNSKLYLLVLYIGFLAPFLLRGLTWAMLYVWTKNYPQVVGTCSGHHGQLISQNCVLTKIRAEPPPPLKSAIQQCGGSNHLEVKYNRKISLQFFTPYIKKAKV